MYRISILSLLICTQLILIVSSDTNDANPNAHSNVVIQTPSVWDTKDLLNDADESDEDLIYVPRSTSFLRFGRQNPPASSSFLRFGRSSPSNFLRFGRGGQQTGGKFLRFGRQAQQQQIPNNFLRFGKKGEFLRFG